MNKKGFTLIEVIVSVVLVSVVMSFMLASLVKIRQTYNSIYEKADGEIYSSSISRIINNDINENGGVKYYSCETDGNTCEFTLGNNRKRTISIYQTEIGNLFLGDVEINNSEGESTKKKTYTVDDKMYCETNPVCTYTTVDKTKKVVCNCYIKKVSNTLKYSDTTEVGKEKIIYIKTLSLKKTTNEDGNISTIGYIFGNMETNSNGYTDPIDSSYENRLSRIIININDSIDSIDTSHNIVISSSSRYKKDKIKYGDEITITLHTISDGIELTNLDIHSYIIQRYGKGFYIKYNKDGQVVYEEAIDNNGKYRLLNIPSSSSYSFKGYYYTDSDNNKIQIIDENGYILVSSTYFKEKNITLEAEWE